MPAERAPREERHTAAERYRIRVSGAWRSAAAGLQPDAGKTRNSAAPAGGAFNRGRGCYLAFLILSSGPAQADSSQISVTLPSGYRTDLVEVIEDRDPMGRAYARLRFVLSDLAGLVGDPDALARDMDHLCGAMAQTRPAILTQADRVVISLSAEFTEYGVANPEILQVFEAYTIDGNHCIWEAF